MAEQEVSTFLASAEKYVDLLIPVKKKFLFFQAACIERIQAEPTNDKTTRGVRTLKEAALGSAFLLEKFKKQVSFVFTGLSLTEGFSLWDGRSAAGAALEDEGPGGGAGRWVGVQVLTGLLGHDQLVLRLPVDHRFPVTHLRKRAAGHSKQPPSHQALGYVDFSQQVCFKIWRFV